MKQGNNKGPQPAKYVGDGVPRFVYNTLVQYQTRVSSCCTVLLGEEVAIVEGGFHKLCSGVGMGLIP